MTLRLVATTVAGSRVIQDLHWPPTAEDARRIAALCTLPGLAEATWTGEHPVPKR